MTQHEQTEAGEPAPPHTGNPVVDQALAEVSGLSEVPLAELEKTDLKPYEAAFRAQFTGRGSMRCDAKECRWTLVPYPQKAPKGMLGEASISLYNLTTTKTTLSCRYGE